MAIEMMLPQMARNWGWIVLRGLAAILFGILSFAWPGITLAVLVIVWGAYALADGLFALMAGIRLPLHMAGNVADVVDVGDGRTAEFHDKTAHARDFS